MLSNKSEWVEEFIAGVFKGIGTMDFSTLKPVSFLEFHPLFAKEWVRWLDEIREAALSKGMDTLNLGQGVSRATDAFDQLVFTLLDFKCARTPRNQRLQIANFFYEMGLYWLKEDFYSLKGKHITHTPGEVEQVFRQQKFQAGTPSVARLLGQIYSATYQLANGLYGDCYMGHSVSNNGPYDASQKYGKDAILVVKEFTNLRPLELWPNADTICHNTIRLYAVYRNVSFSADIFSCHSNYKGDVINGLVAWAVEADGKSVSTVNELEKIRSSMERNAVEKWKHLTSLDFEALKKQCVRMRCYTLSGVCKLLGMNWEPSEKMLESVKNKPLVKGDFWHLPKNEKERRQHWNRILDPREDCFVSANFGKIY